MICLRRPTLVVSSITGSSLHSSSASESSPRALPSAPAAPRIPSIQRSMSRRAYARPCLCPPAVRPAPLPVPLPVPLPGPLPHLKLCPSHTLTTTEGAWRAPLEVYLSIRVRALMAVLLVVVRVRVVTRHGARSLAPPAAARARPQAIPRPPPRAARVVLYVRSARLVRVVALEKNASPRAGGVIAELGSVAARLGVCGYVCAWCA